MGLLSQATYNPGLLWQNKCGRGCAIPQRCDNLLGDEVPSFLEGGFRYIVNAEICGDPVLLIRHNLDMKTIRS
jgi:hypothetical protein